MTNKSDYKRASYRSYVVLEIETGELVGRMWHDSVEIWYFPENSGQALYVRKMERKENERTDMRLVDYWNDESTGLRAEVEEIDRKEVDSYEVP